MFSQPYTIHITFHTKKKENTFGVKNFYQFFTPMISFIFIFLLKTPSFPYISLLMRLVQLIFDQFFPQDRKVFYPPQHFSFQNLQTLEKDRNNEDRPITISRRGSIDSTSRPQKKVNLEIFGIFTRDPSLKEMVMTRL